ncbi:MAG: ABC transporter ATP-binding protein [Planctomycetaceae bacterium]|jgi:ABC-2 type transport system ATP-binding protein|nr:ABC transporter ATP-binding protein [Planctomycetaceae bacterium]
MQSAAIKIEHLSFHYGERCALEDVSWDVNDGELFALLGPNGSGKTTLFRLLSTLIPMQHLPSSPSCSIRVFGNSVESDLSSVRHQLGVVFQSPSVDGKLTVLENLRLQASLYGLTGKNAGDRIVEVSEQLGISERQHDIVDELSGGLRRRLELAKSLLHRPRLLIMDEPTTGLDPAARIDLWNVLRQLQQDSGMTIFMTTHLLEEAERADRVAILNAGQLVALDQPDVLRQQLGGDVVSIKCAAPESLSKLLAAEFNVEPRLVDGQLRLEQDADAAIAEASSNVALVQRIMEQFGDQIQSITVGRPSLEDVFISKTGHQFFQSGELVPTGE